MAAVFETDSDVASHALLLIMALVATKLGSCKHEP